MNSNTNTSTQTYVHEQEIVSASNLERAQQLFYKHREEIKRSSYDQVNVRLPEEINDWLNYVVRETKRIHGSKLPKEIIIETALECMQCVELDWANIKNKQDLMQHLSNYYYELSKSNSSN